MFNELEPVDSRTQRYRQQNAAQEQKEKDAINANYDAQETDTNNVYNKAIGDTKVEYEQDYERNAVQKLINERQIAETNANLGLTDSGLNRTQQTAAQLSYANQKGRLDIAKQSQLDELSLNLASAISTLKQNRQSDLLNIENKWIANAQTQAQNEYKTDVENLASAYESWLDQQEALVKADLDRQTRLDVARINAAAKNNNASNNNSFIYTYSGKDEDAGKVFYEGSDRKIYERDIGLNPYTGDNNIIIGNKIFGDNPSSDQKGEIINGNDTDARKSVALYGTFSNGYQPRGWVDDKTDQGVLEPHDEIPKGNEITGKKQTVWISPITGKYWIWYGDANAYAEAELQNGKWTII